MEITGRIIAVLPVQGGISKNGNEWKKQEYVLETHDQYPKKVCFQIFGADRIDQAAIQPGEELTVFFDIDSREYQGRWFTNKRYIFGRRCLAFPAVFFCPSYFS